MVTQDYSCNPPLSNTIKSVQFSGHSYDNEKTYLYTILMLLSNDRLQSKITPKFLADTDILISDFPKENESNGSWHHLKIKPKNDSCKAKFQFLSEHSPAGMHLRIHQHVPIRDCNKEFEAAHR